MPMSKEQDKQQDKQQDKHHALGARGLGLYTPKIPNQDILLAPGHGGAGSHACVKKKIHVRIKENVQQTERARGILLMRFHQARGEPWPWS